MPSGRPQPRSALLLVGICLGAAGCTARQRTDVVPPPPRPLPPLTVTTVPPPSRPPAEADRDPMERLPPGNPVTLGARDVDVRALLIALSEAAGASLVLDPEVRGRVSVNLVDVPARDAIRAVLASAGLSVASGPPTAPWAPVVFYVLPVDVEEASAELIQARFGVSAELARWIVESRIR